MRKKEVHRNFRRQSKHFYWLRNEGAETKTDAVLGGGQVIGCSSNSGGRDPSLGGDDGAARDT